MKKYAILFGLLLPVLQLFSQTEQSLAEGKVSYITLQNIYAKFEDAGNMKAGDTIFVRKVQTLIPLFIAESVSSTSCVGKPLGNTEVKLSDVVLIRIRSQKKPDLDQPDLAIPSLLNTHPQDSVQTTQPEQPPRTNILERKEKIRGRLSASSYSSFSNSSEFNQRMRYTFSLSADHISGSRISTDSYIMFTHKVNHWPDVRENIFHALKIYSLAVNYELTDKTHFLIGRKTNPRIASIGAIDGIQGETSAGNFTFGAVVGSNPDYSDYSLNPKLFEYGAYLSHDYHTPTGSLVNSIGVFQQTNSGKTDRRFAYYQHSNTLVKNLNLFASVELDLYSVKNSIPVNTLSLTSLYLSLRYRFSRQLTAFGSYDARKNVIYYETFKTYLDQLLEDATRQGYQLRINYKPAKLVYSGISGGYRFRKDDLHPTLNVNGFLTFTQVPWINASVSLSSNWLQTSYVDGMIYGIRIYRDLIPSKLSSGVFYRLVDYNYLNATTSSMQHMAEFELSWQIMKKLSLSANYSGTFEKSNRYSNIYVNLIKRF